mmetsp:Transcript_9327/g.30462  ORF Transcript_9327/g.30462 Transcript_9327/m.30462 type:complete len:354 (+) Transcript_9327:502-1563(+)
MRFTRRPAMAVISVGTAATTRPPRSRSCTGSTDGAHACGVDIEPVGMRIVFGAWHAACAGVDLCRTRAASFQSGFGDVEFCEKSNWPGPSIVPAANDWPMAASQSFPSGAPVSQSTTARPGISTKACATRIRDDRSANSSPARSAAASSTWRPAMIAQESNMSRPGPTDEHCSLRIRVALDQGQGDAPGHVDVSTSQGSPVSRQNAPTMFGVASPRFAEQNAAGTAPRPGAAPGFKTRSRSTDARPLLSELTRPFVLFMDVGCTANHVATARRSPVAASSTRSSVKSVSTSPSYAARSSAGFSRYADGDRLADAFRSWDVATRMVAVLLVASAWAATSASATPDASASTVSGR